MKISKMDAIYMLRLFYCFNVKKNKQKNDVCDIEMNLLNVDRVQHNWIEYSITKWLDH